MILTCNSCNKKFVVPDSAITASGRTVQCGSCGNKWKQFPEQQSKKIQSVSSAQKIVTKPQKFLKEKQKPKKNKKIISRKRREINLYSPEYLAKKHGIKLDEIQDKPIKLFEFCKGTKIVHLRGFAKRKEVKIL